MKPEVLSQHVPEEAIGGYIECSCGWPTREQFEAGEHFAVHVIEALVAGATTRLEGYKHAWLWHEETEEIRAGYGHHMLQLLARLPADSQTTDMAKSIEQMIADLEALLR